VGAITSENDGQAWRGPSETGQGSCPQSAPTHLLDLLNAAPVASLRGFAQHRLELERGVRVDGCWEPWKTGCAVDWDAWSAIAAFVAAFIALRIAGRDRHERRDSERAEAESLALLINSEILGATARLRTILILLYQGGDLDAAATRLASDRRTQIATSNALRGIGLPEARAAVPRLHTMSKSCRLAVILAVIAANVTRIMSDTLKASESSELVDIGFTLAEEYIEDLEGLTEKLAMAESETSKVSGGAGRHFYRPRR
jgi:hypothetical protein